MTNKTEPVVMPPSIEQLRSDWKQHLWLVRAKYKAVGGHNNSAAENAFACLEMLATSKAQLSRLASFVSNLQDEIASELHSRRASGGLRAGVSPLVGIPVSVLKRIERDCRFALEAEEDQP